MRVVMVGGGIADCIQNGALTAERLFECQVRQD